MPTKTRLPIFEIYSVSELAYQLDYSERYVIDLRDGRKAIGRRFKATAAKILHRSINDLFGPYGDSDA